LNLDSTHRYNTGQPPDRRAESENLMSNRPERSSVDIDALRETRFSEQGHIGEVDAGYTFFWTDRPKAERRDADVAFAIQREAVERMVNFYRRFLSNCADIMQTLINMLFGPKGPLELTREALNALLTHPAPEAQLSLMVNASNVDVGLYGLMRFHDSGIYRNADNTDTSCTVSAFAISTTTATTTITSGIPQAVPAFSCPDCARNFNSHTGLIGPLRIYRTDAGESLPGAPSCSRRARIHRPPCSHTFTHHMGL
uniref:DNA-directed DNA polymerase n=1 Tax=Schistocephalus solidus TaxID=70667 RepID=A0A183TR91_SCHSO